MDVAGHQCPPDLQRRETDLLGDRGKVETHTQRCADGQAEAVWAADGCRGIFDLNGTSLPCESIGAAVTMCKPHGSHGHHAAMHAEGGRTRCQA